MPQVNEFSWTINMLVINMILGAVFLNASYGGKMKSSSVKIAQNKFLATLMI